MVGLHSKVAHMFTFRASLQKYIISINSFIFLFVLLMTFFEHLFCAHAWDNISNET